jgi:hypothetical protein
MDGTSVRIRALRKMTVWTLAYSFTSLTSTFTTWIIDIDECFFVLYKEGRSVVGVVKLIYYTHLFS